LEASRPVKAPDSHIGVFICVDLPHRTERAFLKPEGTEREGHAYSFPDAQ
jgi:hypothetical protein